jgi:hypothetical protein
MIQISASDKAYSAKITNGGNMAQKERYRLRFPFWLDMNKPDEAMLADDIELLKNERSFARTVRDGIRLMISLRRRDLSVLHELFPWIHEALAINNRGSDDLRNEFESLRNLILQQGSLAAPDYPVMKPVSGGLKPMTGEGSVALPGLRPVSKPVFDDDDDMLSLEKVKSDATQNLFKHLVGLS